MLVLTRKVDESILIGEDINIKILSLSNTQVKIGISAPRNLRILRKEVYDEIASGQRKDAPPGKTDANSTPPLPRSSQPEGSAEAPSPPGDS